VGWYELWKQAGGMLVKFYLGWWVGMQEDGGMVMLRFF
jgi:hypothetical protein